MKRAQSLGINTVILTAIALLVLVIIAFVVIDRGGDLGDGTACIAEGGQCLTPGSSDSMGRTPISGVECPGQDVCYSATG